MDSIHVAAYNGDIAWLRSLLTEGALPDARDSSGFTPLLWASFRARVTNMVPVIEALVEAGADPNAVTGNGDANCLILAAQAGVKKAVVALIAAGADVNGTADGLSPHASRKRGTHDYRETFTSCRRRSLLSVSLLQSR